MARRCRFCILVTGLMISCLRCRFGGLICSGRLVFIMYLVWCRIRREFLYRAGMLIRTRRMFGIRILLGNFRLALVLSDLSARLIMCRCLRRFVVLISRSLGVLILMLDTKFRLLIMNVCRRVLICVWVTCILHWGILHGRVSVFVIRTWCMLSLFFRLIT